MSQSRSELGEGVLEDQVERDRLNAAAGIPNSASQAATANGQPAEASFTAVTGRTVGRARWWRDSLRRRLLALADLLAVMIAAVLVLPSEAAVLWAATFLPVWIVLAKVMGNYDRDHRTIRQLTTEEIPQLIAWAALGSLALTAYLTLTPAGELAGSVTIELFLASALGVVALRGAIRALWRSLSPAERAVVIGRGPAAESVERKLPMASGTGVEVIRTVDPPVPEASRAERLRWFQDLTSDVDRIIVAPEHVSEDVVGDLRALCREKQVKLTAISSLRGRALPASRITEVADMPMLDFDTWDVSRSTIVMKRAFDIVFSAAGLIIAAPLLVLIAVSVKLGSHGPVLFSQLRAGAGAKPFRMLKFRTMRDGAEKQVSELVRLDELDEPMFKLREDPRVTGVGRVLRRLSLDELPQLLNVLRGQMSIVGPRPEELELVERYKPEHRLRLAVKPGMTGPMQVNGRANLTFAERLALELNYIENLSLGRDLRLLAQTASAVVRRSGAY
jgi:exopolysaccharide biosynthesis polyprenyl glycosylphosphotransferase